MKKIKGAKDFKHAEHEVNESFKEEMREHKSHSLAMRIDGRGMEIKR